MPENAPLISVIVPVYNVEPYLKRCIDSILAQTYQNLEIILVDDGSPDNCGSICDAYASLDARIRVIHKKNGGLSSARNAGLDICTGEYIGFVDSDDWIEPRMYESLLDACLRQDAPVAVCGVYSVSGKTGEKTVLLCPNEEGRISGETAIGRILTWDGFDVSCCTKLFRWDLWQDIRMPVGEIGEDTAVIFRILHQAEWVALCPQCLYNYYQREGSITAVSFSPRDFDIVRHAEEILDFVRKQCPAVTEQAIYFHIVELAYVLGRLCCEKRETRERYRDKYVRYRKSLWAYRNVWLRSPRFSAKDRARFLLVVTGLYRVLDWAQKIRR